MTVVITRSPLQSLNMATSQGTTRRRSAASTADEQGDLRPQKRQKVDDAPQAEAKQPNGTKVAQKKSKAAYDEDVDGFSFRKRPKVAAKANKVALEETADARSHSPPRAAAKEKKRVSQGTSSASDAPAPAPAPAPKRRSARLSGEESSEQAGKTKEKEDDVPKARRTERKEEEVPSKKGPGRRQSRTSQEAARVTPVPKEGQLHVGRRRETKIALPFADTPIIDRNREMRDVSNSSRRRSSSGMRGRRASSLMNSGSSSGRPSPAPGKSDDAPPPTCANLCAEPHAEVKTEEFYKHISQDLPEQERMRQLLTWCGSRALSELPKSRASGHFNAIRAARTIQEELLRDFTTRPEMSDWFSRPEETAAQPVALVKKANPRNQQNAAKLVELEQQVKRLEAERHSWDRLLGHLSGSLESRRIAPDKSTDYASAVANINPSILDAPGQKDALAVAASFDSESRVVKDRVQKACDSIEFAVDNFAHALHQTHSFKQIVDDAADRLLADTAQALEHRDRSARERSGMDKVGVGDILRSIGKAS